MDDEEYDIKKSLSATVFVIFMCGIWSLASVFVIALIPLSLIDWIFGIELVSAMQNLLLSGSEGSRYFKIWLCGIPLTLIWLKDKNLKI
jgi:hypothetical protein